MFMDRHFKKLVDEETPRPGLMLADGGWRLFEALQILPGGRFMLARDCSFHCVSALAVSNEFYVLAGSQEELDRLPRPSELRLPDVGALVVTEGLTHRISNNAGYYLHGRLADGDHTLIDWRSEYVRVIWSPSEPAQDFVFMRPCALCGKQHYNDDLTRARCALGEVDVCPDCLEELFEECGGCGEYFLKGSLTNYDLCDSCFDKRYFVCAHCGRTVDRREANACDGNLYCNDCYDILFAQCERCGRVIDRDFAYHDEHSDETLCESCYDETHRGALYPHGHSRSAPKVFHGDDSDMFYGLELEMESRKAGVVAVARAITDPDEADWRLEEDGSLIDGIEVVSMPRTFKSWREFWPEYDRRILAVARGFGCTAHDNGRCGIHVHTSLDAWDGDQLLRLFALVYNPDNYRRLLKVSQRTEAQLSEWASLCLEDIGNSQAKNKIKNKKSPFHCRAAALNITETTLEVRLFRSSTRLDRVMKCMEFVHALYCYTGEVKKATWSGLMQWARRNRDKTPNLCAFLIEKGLMAEKRRARAAA
jgi:hypothetical protein